ncbi:MAG: DUF488 domain-containing protein [Deltaproteobacteria bacterium]|nr:DUF488 domain-containing protein [Deltaproteobacteria bacterium]
MAGRIYTIGHGGRSFDSFLDQLQRAEVQYVIDVRSSPYSSHQPEFAKKPLSERLGRAGIGYVFMGDALGGRPADPDCYSGGKVDYGRCRTKDFFRRGIGRVRSAYAQGLRICLLCSEGKPDNCHRARLIGAVLSEEGIDVLHILPDGTTRTQQELVRERTGGQVDLFGKRRPAARGDSS